MTTSQFFLKPIVFLLLAGLVSCLLGCEKPNPNPENLDPIYADLEKGLKAAETDLKAAEKQLEDFRADLLKVVPQTGQVKFARKRVYDGEAVVQKLRQRVTFMTFRVESRLEYARKDYMRSYNKDKKAPWPQASEATEYRAQQELELAPKTWNARARLEASKPPEKPKAGAGHSDSAEPAAKSAH